MYIVFSEYLVVSVAPVTCLRHSWCLASLYISYSNLYCDSQLVSKIWMLPIVLVRSETSRCEPEPRDKWGLVRDDGYSSA